MNELWIGLFAILGGSLRYSLSQWWALDTFPIGTLAVNLIGCFLLSFLNQTLAHSKRVPTQLTLGIGTGFIGAFTTFSSFMNDAVQLMLQAQYFRAGIYLIGSIGLGLGFGFIGYYAGRYCWASLIAQQRARRDLAARQILSEIAPTQRDLKHK